MRRSRPGEAPRLEVPWRVGLRCGKCQARGSSEARGRAASGLAGCGQELDVILCSKKAVWGFKSRVTFSYFKLVKRLPWLLAGDKTIRELEWKLRVRGAARAAVPAGDGGPWW